MNLLKKHDEVINYLKGLKNNLEVLKIADNPFQKTGGSTDGDYKLYAINYLKGLKYLDYELIKSQMREQAKQKHTDEVDKDAGGALEDDSSKIVD